MNQKGNDGHGKSGKNFKYSRKVIFYWAPTDEIPCMEFKLSYTEVPKKSLIPVYDKLYFIVSRWRKDIDKFRTRPPFPTQFSSFSSSF